MLPISSRADVDAMLEHRPAPRLRPLMRPSFAASSCRTRATIYSGPIAATAYAFLATAVRPTMRPRRIVIMGPSHFEPLGGLAVTGARAWRTPLGDAVVDASGRDLIVSAGARVDEVVHRREHSIEVQLPFIQRCFPDVPVLPVAVGTGAPERGARTLAAALTDDALLVVSSDLSHYLDADTARRLDADTAAAIERLDLERLRSGDACGVDALRVGMAWARSGGYRIRTLDLRNSADTAGDPTRVVGYGAFAITASG